jgi:uncharacterized LabA/DUF88 family protein
VVALVEAAASNVVDAIVLGAGDHAYVPAMRLASLTAKKLFVVSTAGSCSIALRAIAQKVIDIPVREKRQPELAVPRTDLERQGT